MPKAQKKKTAFDPHNKRLDQFLTNLQIEQEKKEKILKYVQELTFETLQQTSRPKLRLKR